MSGTFSAKHPSGRFAGKGTGHLFPARSLNVPPAAGIVADRTISARGGIELHRFADTGRIGFRLRLKGPDEQRAFSDKASRKNVIRVLHDILEQSGTIRRLVDQRKIALVGAMYDVASAEIEFFMDEAIRLEGEGRLKAGLRTGITANPLVPLS